MYHKIIQIVFSGPIVNSLTFPFGGREAPLLVFFLGSNTKLIESSWSAASRLRRRGLS